MKQEFMKQQTVAVNLDTVKCKACWKCLDACPNNIFDGVSILWHKHALIVNGNNCTGCLRCVKVCEYNAITKINH